ncbi:MAG TPA: hypothetical protein VFB27_10285 [Opitutaceae bacterium]|nr:hypothetical protein [Opitutaceae bacterium]
MKNSRRLCWLLGVVIWFAAHATGLAAALSNRLIQAGVYASPSTGVQYPYQLWQINEVGGRTTYAMWIPADSSQGLRPAVLVTEPYEGLTWSSDAVDQAWAARFNPDQPLYPDVNGPFYDPATGGSILYSVPIPDQLVSQGINYLVNNVSVLFVFERFYAGGSVVDNVKDATLGLRFLSQLPGVDPAHLGILGSSWGGFEALYGAANAPAGAAPIVGVAWYPPSDLSQFYQYIVLGLPALIQDPNLLAVHQQFYDPYRRRIIAGTLASLSPPSLNFSSFVPDYLRANLRTNFLVLHDQWDTLVPFAQSVALASALPDRIQGFWYPHIGPPNYNLLSLSHVPVPGLDENSAMVFSSAYLLEHLLPANAPISISYDSSAFLKFFGYMRSVEALGADISTLIPRLGDLANSHVTLIDVNTSNSLPPVPGSFWVGYFLSLP